MQIVIDISEKDYAYIKEQVDAGITNPLKIIIANGTLLPKNPTNGDMIKAMFPNCEVCTHEFVGLKCGVDVKFYLCENVYFTVWFTTDWWNAPYKGVSE